MMIMCSKMNVNALNESIFLVNFFGVQRVRFWLKDKRREPQSGNTTTTLNLRHYLFLSKYKYQIVHVINVVISVRINSPRRAILTVLWIESTVEVIVQAILIISSPR